MSSARSVVLVLLASLAAVAGGAGCSSSGDPARPAGTTAASSQSAAAPTPAPATASASGATSAAATAAPTASAAAGSSACPEGMVEIAHPTRMCMSKTEVTVAQYKACVDAKKCTHKPREIPGCNFKDDSKSDHPMNCVSRTDATAYCTGMLGGSLPSVDQWEAASRDGETKPYAWGTADPQRAAEDNLWCWSGKQKRTGTCAAGSFPAGATKSGLLDMAGNVAEWATGMDEEEKSKTCGRAWDATEGWKAMEKCPGGYFAEAQTPIIGFRCVAPAK